MEKTKLDQSQIDLAASLIGIIDSKEKSIFLETVNTEKQIEASSFHDGDLTGVFYSCLIDGKLVIHLSFTDDTDKFNEKIAERICFALKKSNLTSCLIWTAQKYRKSRMFLKEKFNIQPDSHGDYYAPGYNGYFYEAVEFIMRREMFTNEIENSNLAIRPFEVQFVGMYLSLLNDVMAFDGLPPNFQGNKEHFLKPFEERIESNSFEAFWKENELIGLYWRNDADIDIMAVAKSQQGKGYGSIILIRAINMVFRKTTNNYARLYVLGWDEKTIRFYKQFGMEQTGHCYRLCLR